MQDFYRCLDIYCRLRSNHQEVRVGFPLASLITFTQGQFLFNASGRQSKYCSFLDKMYSRKPVGNCGTSSSSFSSSVKFQDDKKVEFLVERIEFRFEIFDVCYSKTTFFLTSFTFIV